MNRRWAVGCLFLGSLTLQADEMPRPKLPTSGLVLPSVSRGGRSLVFTDALESQRLDSARTPIKAGDEVKLPDGSARRWASVQAGDDGVFQSPALRGGYLRLEVEAADQAVMILRGTGFGFAAINGEPRTGDTYGTGWLLTPIMLNKGLNELLFQGRGNAIKVELVPPPSDVFLTDVDWTLPDVIADEQKTQWLGVRVINASDRPRNVGVQVACGTEAVARPGAPRHTLPPLSQTKIPCSFTAPSAAGIDQLPVRLQLTGDAEGSLEVTLPVRQPRDKHRRTFISEIDGSVQYYAVVPASGADGPIGLTLTLHGAGVEATGQAACFQPKPWTHVVAATNRRPFGFDWEDWGRLDALEVLHDAETLFQTDPRRRWLTGHSMGGHGTWHLGVTYPDRFAAIGPSAGWISMFSYAGMRRDESDDPIAAIFRRATQASDTLEFVNNLASIGVYVLHGDRDDNVPVSQARTMRTELAKFHPDWVYREQPGAGHWWGDPCVDWPPMFQFFEQRTIPERKDVRRVAFTTASPGVSADCHWARIDAQIKPWEISSIAIDHDPTKRTFRGQTNNVARLALDGNHLAADGAITVELDGQKLANVPRTAEGIIWLALENQQWSIADRPSPTLKGPHRYGGFKDAFRHRMLLVYGTTGTPDENAWALAKARYDAESFYYRGNGSPQVMADIDFDPAKEPNRNVVLYGHAECNHAWKALLGSAPVQVRRGSVTIGDREVAGDDSACLFLYPRPGSDFASVGVVGGTGLKGLRATNRLPLFVSGVGIPDLVILSSSFLSAGPSGIVAAGYFGNDWSVERGDIVWR